jgi:D-3-phosphoglycerate dehydrogenase
MMEELSMFNIYVAEKSYRNYSEEKSIVEAGGGRLLFAHCSSEQDIIDQCTDAHALLLRQTPVGEKAFRSLKKLRVVARYGVGYDNVDIAAATRTGVLVTIIPDYCIQEVADHTAALLLSSIRKTVLRDRLVRRGEWDIGSRYPVFRTNRKILGLVGYGKTAREVRKRLSGFPFRFAACDPYADRTAFETDNTQRLGFRTLLLVSDYISIHVPLNKETHHLFNMEAFRKMRRNAVLINTSRGPIVDTRDLYTALSDGYIGGAALDVYEDEPFVRSNPLAELDSVVLSDHAAWYSVESQAELQRRTAMEAVRALRGGFPENPINPEVLASRIIEIKQSGSTPKQRELLKLSN